MEIMSMLIMFLSFAVVGACTELIFGVNIQKFFSDVCIALGVTGIIAYSTQVFEGKMTLQALWDIFGQVFVDNVLPMAIGAFFGTAVSHGFKRLIGVY